MIPAALWELTDWWNNERVARWVDAGVSRRLFLPSACMNATDPSRAGRPPPPPPAVSGMAVVPAE